MITIDFDRNGEANFKISATICDLSYERMNELRAMIVVAIGTAEDMWRRANQGTIAVEGKPVAPAEGA